MSRLSRLYILPLLQQQQHQQTKLFPTCVWSALRIYDLYFTTILSMVSVSTVKKKFIFFVISFASFLVSFPLLTSVSSAKSLLPVGVISKSSFPKYPRCVCFHFAISIFSFILEFLIPSLHVQASNLAFPYHSH